MNVVFKGSKVQKNDIEPHFNVHIKGNVLMDAHGPWLSVVPL
jgi:hypothetical protein